MVIASATLVMFGLMYLNTYQIDHDLFPETRAYMALIMGGTMAVGRNQKLWFRKTAMDSSELMNLIEIKPARPLRA